MSTVLASGADARYGWWLLNLIGSVHVNSRHSFDAVVVYDLGLSPSQRRLAAGIRGVELRTVPEFVPHWRQGFTWKAWVWMNLEAERLVWLDAGATVLAPLDEALEQIDERGYWVVSQRHPIGEIVPSDYYALYDFPRERSTRTVIAAGLIGFARSSDFFADVAAPTYEDCLEGRSLGFSPGEERRLNNGLNYTAAPVLRDCVHFRWDQTVLNLRFHGAYDDPVIGDFDRWAGRTGPRDHPRQVIWAHRRDGDLRYLTRVPYRLPARVAGLPVGLVLRSRRWWSLHRWAFRPSTYVRKARRMLANGDQGRS
jgi:hypothetical protein